MTKSDKLDKEKNVNKDYTHKINLPNLICQSHCRKQCQDLKLSLWLQIIFKAQQQEILYLKVSDTHKTKMAKRFFFK